MWAEEKEKFLDDAGNLKEMPPPKRQKLIHDGDFHQAEDANNWIEINVSGVQWDEANDKILEMNDLEVIPQGPDLSWTDNIDQNDPIKAHVCDLTGILDSDLLSDAVGENLRESKFRMAAGSTTPNGQDNELFIDLEASTVGGCTEPVFPESRVSVLRRKIGAGRL